MTRPLTASKVLVLTDGRPGPLAAPATIVRRYRLARLRLDGRSSAPGTRFEHIKRTFD